MDVFASKLFAAILLGSLVVFLVIINRFYKLSDFTNPTTTGARLCEYSIVWIFHNNSTIQQLCEELKPKVYSFGLFFQKVVKKCFEKVLYVH